MKYQKNVVLLSLFLMNLVEQPAPVVEIDQGLVSGKISSDGTYYEYLGIPYGSFNRETMFKAPLPPPQWDGVYKATDEIYWCPQPFMPNVVLGSEDCLVVNVYVPVNAQKPLSVMVYNHGGAFTFGNSGKLFHGPDYLIHNDIIFVTFNYRLGNIGFMCLGIEEAPGNAGLKDQLAALRWIKKNIKAFGGDPDNITLFGESAGAASTSILLATGKADGLINKAIIQSGSSLADWAVTTNPVKTASLLTKTLGYDTEDPHEIYKILSKLSYKEFAGVKPDKPLNKYLDSDVIYLLPCIEKSFPDTEAILTDVPYKSLSKKANNIPVVIGTTSREGLFTLYFDSDAVISKRNNMFLFYKDLTFKNEDEAANVSQKIKEFYFGDENINENNTDKLESLYSDLYFRMPAALETDVLLSNSNAPVYNYWFNYNGDRNFPKMLVGGGNTTGASHSDDLCYILSANIWPFRITARDRKFIDTITRLWTNFAKYSDPTPPFDHSIPFQWIPSKKDDLKYLYIDETFKMGPMPDNKSYGLWKDIYRRHRKLKISHYFG